MIFMFFSNLLLGVAFCVHIVLAHRERSKLIEMLAAKDYVEYKHMEQPAEQHKEHKNMFTKRARAEQSYIIQEGE